MIALQYILFTKETYYWCDKIKEDKIGGHL